MTTLKEALGILGAAVAKIRKDITQELLGKYRGIIIPKSQNSASFIKTQRNTLYGKIK